MSSIYKIMVKYAPIAFCAILILACRYEFPQGSLLHVSNCRTEESNRRGLAADSLHKECIHYEYDGINKLYFTHENRWFNNPSGQISAVVTVESDTIFIAEKAGGTQASKNGCLYDLEYVVDNLKEGKYTLKMDHMDPFELEINLTVSYSGSYCIDSLPNPI